MRIGAACPSSGDLFYLTQREAEGTEAHRGFIASSHRRRKIKNMMFINYDEGARTPQPSLRLCFISASSA